MNYSDLDVFKKSHQLVLTLYQITNKFPKDEKYRIIDQMIRAAYSIPANIVEGNSRNTTRDYIRFLYNSRGSLNELNYFLLLSKGLCYITSSLYNDLILQTEEIGKMLNGLISSLKKK
ncbi:MAG: four helix bundle protein [Candidatus Cloacimonetes bacterium]|nr:four helix bundle protein [Candidatus Cloacimonadota bacterium]